MRLKAVRTSQPASEDKERYSLFRNLNEKPAAFVFLAFYPDPRFLNNPNRALPVISYQLCRIMMQEAQAGNTSHPAYCTNVDWSTWTYS